MSAWPARDESGLPKSMPMLAYPFDERARAIEAAATAFIAAHDVHEKRGNVHYQEDVRRERLARESLRAALAMPKGGRK